MVKGLGERLQKQRLLLNISQKEAAIVIGASASVISNYESGERTPSIENLIALANLYHVSTDYLLGFTSDNKIVVDTSMLNQSQTQILQHFLNSLK
ncbi:MAG: helix-turn-helix transcriptional regulator [Catenibacterium mitsuokai]|nr:helix-turn-helix transcriptional regulator [Catenibacterium mitsuokai]MDD6594545.1 helix-turn-helix transcriptional regulator [Catenibacterium mitsuokai]